ncbi:MAG: hypothetical protein OXB90_04655 [Acidimicrobiaceae bacterium]|nr:hypothetical protein [Acidimicrobiaceae bacterium]
MLMGRAGKKMTFPFYNPAAWSSLPIPDINDERIVLMLADSWEQTRYEIVPQFRDGYTEIRQQWDQAVCNALDWDLDEITHLGKLLADEPRVKGVANGHWKP